MKSILCFGDSNTYGMNPVTAGRWPRDIRWTGVLQNLLGPDYYVIEEGYNGRTTVPVDKRDPYASGIDAIYPVMKTHSPVDMVIIMLGTNDLKAHFATSAKASAMFCESILTKIRCFCFEKSYAMPEILIISPAHVGKDIAESRFWGLDESAYTKSLEFSKWYSLMAKNNGVHFLDAARFAKVGKDQLHLDSESHKALAEAIFEEVKDIIG